MGYNRQLDYRCQYSYATVLLILMYFSGSFGPVWSIELGNVSLLQC